MNSSMSKFAIVASLLLFSAACTKSKDSNGNSTPTPPAVADGISQPIARTISHPTADNTPLTPEQKEGDNSANTLSFDGPISQEQLDAIAKEAAKFSSAAEDSLREFLINKSADETDFTKKAKNLKFAGVIFTAKLKVSEDKNSFKVVLKIMDSTPNKDKYLSFVGTSKQVKDAKSNKMYLPRKFALQAFDKEGKEFKNQSGTLECVDAKYTRIFDCQTKVATINLNGATAKIIFRTSAMNTIAKFADSKCIAKACDDLYDLFYNSEYEVKSARRIKSAVMETFEVINGRSAFNILIVSYDDEVIKMEGNLPAAEFSEKSEDKVDLDTPLNMKLTSEEMRDPVNKKLRKTRLNTQMHSTYLQSNDGRGSIKIKVRMAMEKDANDLDVFDLNFSRILNPIKVLQ